MLITKISSIDGINTCTPSEECDILHVSTNRLNIVSI